ncbi:MAG: 5-formyltetrahydrofolate cyclo-ligase [Paludibacter sp.]
MSKLKESIIHFFSNKAEKTSIEKNKIRVQIKNLKKEITDAQKQKKSVEVFNKIALTSEFKAAKSILIYWSSDDELPTHEFIAEWKDKKCILLPIVVGEKMEIKRFTSIEKMKKGYKGIWEPYSEESYCGNPDLIIVPGVAFDLKKNRLGRGKGFYDRYFSQSKAPKWGVGFDFQLLKSVPFNENDVQLDKIFTPSRTIE